MSSKKRKNENIHAGPSFDDFLKEEGIFEHCQEVGAKYAFVMQLQDEMEKQQLTKEEFAKRIGTSRSPLDRSSFQDQKNMNFFTRNLKRLSLYFIASTLLSTPILTANDVKEAEYVWPIDEDNVIPLPITSLRGKLIRHTFPGPPNYESVKDGDSPETRWILEISEEEIQKLVNSNYVPKDVYQSSKEDWVQVISPGTEQTPQPFSNKKVVITGYLGILRTHRHTYITIEAKDIYEE